MHRLHLYASLTLGLLEEGQLFNHFCCCYMEEIFPSTENPHNVSADGKWYCDSIIKIPAIILHFCIKVDKFLHHFWFSD